MTKANMMQNAIRKQEKGGGFSDAERASLQLSPDQANMPLTMPFGRLLALLNVIEKKLPAETKCPVVHFISPAKGEGADVLALEAAYVASLAGRKVLFIGRKGSAVPANWNRLNVGAALPLNGSLKDGEQASARLSAVPGTTLSVASLADLDSNAGPVSDGMAHRAIFENLKPAFDMIVTYSEQGLTNPLAAILYGITDSAVLVAQAERTRIPVVRGLRRQVELQGGRVTGAVLTKRKFHIPQFIYTMLFKS